MEIIEVLVLALVQGVIEFLPISSSGHLILVDNWLSVSEANELALYAILHFATTLAVVLYFRSDLWVLIQVALRKLGRLPVNEKDITLLYALIVATIPAVFIGVLFEEVITKYLWTPIFVASALLFSAIFFIYVEWKYYLRPVQGEINLRTAVKVGLFQAVALLPGVSRSGATLAGGMLLGLSRYESARFSFLLAIPITLGVGIKKSLDLLREGGQVDWSLIGVGAVISFFTALLVIHFFLAFIRRYTLWPFVWYGIILAGLVGYINFFA